MLSLIQQEFTFESECVYMHLFQKLPLAFSFSPNTFLACILLPGLSAILAWWHSSSHCLCRSSMRSLRIERSSALIYTDRVSFSRERWARSSVHPSTAFSNSLKEVHKEKGPVCKQISACVDEAWRQALLYHWIKVISQQTHHFKWTVSASFKRKRQYQPPM